MKFSFQLICLMSVLFLSGCEFLGWQDDTPSIPGKIVFSMADDSENESDQIFVMNTDGSGLRQLTHSDFEYGPGEDESGFDGSMPYWSPDGKQIVFSSFYKASSDGPELWVMNADGSNLRPLYAPYPQNPKKLSIVGYNPQWSPDGTKIAYDKCTNCQIGGVNSEVFIYDFIADSVIPVTHQNEIDTRDSHPTWSPDGTQIAFASGRDYIHAEEDRWRQDLYRVNIDGTGLERLTETGNAGFPKWHPEKSVMAYEWRTHGNISYILDIDTKEVEKIETDMRFSGFPQWSANGKYIIIYGRKDDDASPEIQFFKYENKESIFIRRLINNKLSSAIYVDWYFNENE